MPDKITIIWAIPSFIIDFHELTYSEPSIAEADLFAVLNVPLLGSRPVPVFLEFSKGSNGGIWGPELQVKRFLELEPMRGHIAVLVTNRYILLSPESTPPITLPNEVSFIERADEGLLAKLLDSIADELESEDSPAQYDRVAKAMLALSTLALVDWGIKEVSQYLDTLYLFGEVKALRDAYDSRQIRTLSPSVSPPTDAALLIPRPDREVLSEGSGRCSRIAVDLLGKIVDLKVDLLNLDILSGMGKEGVRKYTESVSILAGKYSQIIKVITDAVKACGKTNDDGRIELRNLLTSMGHGIDLSYYLRGCETRYEVHVFVPILGGSKIIKRLAESLINSLLLPSLASHDELRITLHLYHTARSKRDSETLQRELMNGLSKRGIEHVSIDSEQIEPEERSPTLGETIAAKLLERIIDDSGVLLLLGEVPKEIVINLAIMAAAKEGSGSRSCLPISSRILVAVPKRPSIESLQTAGCQKDAKQSETKNSGSQDDERQCGLFRVRVKDDSLIINDVMNRTDRVTNGDGERSDYYFVPLNIVH